MTTRHPYIRKKLAPTSPTSCGRSVCQYSSLADSGHGDCLFNVGCPLSHYVVHKIPQFDFVMGQINTYRTTKTRNFRTYVMLLRLRVLSYLCYVSLQKYRINFSIRMRDMCPNHINLLELITSFASPT
jgi:hypothetical protein